MKPTNNVNYANNWYTLNYSHHCAKNKSLNIPNEANKQCQLCQYLDTKS